MPGNTFSDQSAHDALAAVLDRAERDIAAQRDAYGTELDEDRAWRCAWNTWRTLTDLTAAVRAQLTEQGAAANVIELRTDQPTDRMPLGRSA